MGLNETDLSDNPEYREFVSRKIRLQPFKNEIWQLKKFDGGRYYIEKSESFNYRKVICNLDSGSLVITKIFNDSINGGIFFSAIVSCNKGEFDAPLNNWSSNLKVSISFLDTAGS